MKFRALSPDDEPLIRRFLALATHLSPEEVAKHPHWSRYAESWGRDGDFALCASKLRDGQHENVGLIWSRLFPETHVGSGFVAPDVPEMMMFVESAPDLKHTRGQLLEYYLRSLANRSKAVSTHLDSHDLTAIRLHQSAGFRVVEEKPGGVTTMLLEF